jgi:alkyl sulfatase BDS1-like metallo-beta-lactamase superfamily hydrolase
MSAQQSAASKALEEVRQLVAADDRRDFEFAERGFIATRDRKSVV